LTLTDSSGATATGTASLIVNLHVTTNTCNAKKSTAMSGFSLAATGGTAPLTWTASGQPAWASISSAGVITGVATGTTGSYSFTVSVTDSTGRTGTTTFTIVVVNGAPSNPQC